MLSQSEEVREWNAVPIETFREELGWFYACFLAAFRCRRLPSQRFS